MVKSGAMNSVLDVLMLGRRKWMVSYGPEEPQEGCRMVIMVHMDNVVSHGWCGKPWIMCIWIMWTISILPSGKRLHNELEKSTMLCSWVNTHKYTISMAICNTYLKLPEASWKYCCSVFFGTPNYKNCWVWWWGERNCIGLTETKIQRGRGSTLA